MKNKKRQLGKILPTKQGNTAEAEAELIQQHDLAFREAVMSISSWVRAAYDMDRPGFFKDLRHMVDSWEKDDKRSASQILTGYTGK